MVLAWIFHQRGGLHGIVHCDFALREESIEEADFVAEMAAKWGIPFFSKRLETADYALDNKISVQVAARELRYDFFRELIDKEGFDWVVLGHHADDQAESILMNLLRGGSSRHLMGIPRVNGPFWRPLLDYSKADILKFAEDNQIPFRLDPSNDSSKYLRNLIRNELAPVLSTVNPSWQHQLIEREKSYAAQFQWLMDHSFRESAVKKDQETGNIEINLNTHSSEELKIFLPLWLENEGFSGIHAVEIARLIDSEVGRKLFLEGFEILKDRQTIVIRKVKKESEAVELLVSLDEVGEKEWEIKQQRLRLEWHNANDSLKSGKGEEMFRMDAEKIHWPLKVRTWQKGDRMQPLGFHGTKKIKDIFIDQKVSRFNKSEVLLFEDAKQIICLSGFRIAEGVKLDQNTKKELRIYLKTV